MTTNFSSINIEFDDNNILSSLFGINDTNIKVLEKIYKVKIEYRGNKVKIIGENQLINKTKLELESLFSEAKKGIEIDEEKIKDTKSLLELEINPSSQLDFFIQTKKRKIIPRSSNQKEYFKLLSNKNIVFAVGPAGTGKTYLAVAKAVAELQKGNVKKIILSRPAVEAGEKLGFLPGDLKEKVDPYLTPLYDALNDMIPHDKLKIYLDQRTIEIAPLAYMRGRTLHNSFIILDEAQNATPMQMKMFLTRLGVTSKAIITGDVTQIDLPVHNKSGLIDAVNILKKVDGISFVYFDVMDVVRHTLVKNIIKAYEKSDNKTKKVKKN